MCKSWIQYIFLLIFLFLLAVLYDTNITFLVFIVFTMLPLPLLVMGLSLRTKISTGMKVDVKTVQKGESFLVDIYIENRSFLPISHCNITFEYGNLYSKYKKKEKLTLSVSGFQKRTASFHVFSEYCGMLEFSVRNIRILDFFGLFSFGIPSHFQYRITVLPNINTTEIQLLRHNPWISADPEEYASNKSGDDCSELYGVREYTQGDRFNRIHWRLSERFDKLMVKEFGLPLDSSVAILADFFVQSIEMIQLAQYDAIIETICMISASLQEQGQAHYVVWFDDRLKECCKLKMRKAEDLYELIGSLFECNFQHRNSSVLKAYRTGIRHEPFTNMFYITSRISEEDVLAWDESDFLAQRHVVLLKSQEAVQSEEVLKAHKISYQTLEVPYTSDNIEKVISPIETEQEIL